MEPDERSINPVCFETIKHHQFSLFFSAPLKKSMLSSNTVNRQLWTEQGDGASCSQELGFFSVPLVFVFLWIF